MKAEFCIRTLHEFFEEQKGAAVILSDDKVFHRTLRSAVHRVAGSKRDCLFGVGSRQTAMRTVDRMTENEVPLLVFVERMVNEEPSTDFIIVLKRKYPDIKVIVLAWDIQRDLIAYFMELGVANVICKPASMNNIIEKMAFSLSPPNHLGQLMEKGKDLLDEERYGEALSVVNDILDMKPGSPAGLMLQGDIHLATGDRPAALDSYLSAHHSSDMYIEPIKRLVTALRGMDDDRALEYLKKLDFLSPLNPDRKADIGKVYLEKKDLEHAEEYFDKSIEIMGREARSLVSLMADQIARAATEVSPGMVEKYLKTAIESKPGKLGKEDIHTFNRLGIALRSQGKWRDAVENYERALHISPDDEVLYYNLALAYQDGRDFRNAMTALNRARDINPDLHTASDMVAANMGNIHLDFGDVAGAEEYYTQSLAMNADNRRAMQGLGRAAAARKRAEAE